MFRASLLLLVSVAPVTVPGARANREFGADGSGAPQDCAAAAEQLKVAEAGLKDVLEARTQLYLLLQSNWTMYFAGSLGNDTASADRVSKSLQEQHRTLRSLTLVGRRRKKELQAKLSSCGADVAASSGPGATRAASPPSNSTGLGHGGRNLERFRARAGFNKGIGLQGDGNRTRPKAQARGIG